MCHNDHLELNKCSKDGNSMCQKGSEEIKSSSQTQSAYNFFFSSAGEGCEKKKERVNDNCTRKFSEGGFNTHTYSIGCASGCCLRDGNLKCWILYTLRPPNSSMYLTLKLADRYWYQVWDSEALRTVELILILLSHQGYNPHPGSDSASFAVVHLRGCRCPISLKAVIA